jgi:hypothetical protein
LAEKHGCPNLFLSITGALGHLKPVDKRLSRSDWRTDDPKVTVWRSSSAMKPAETVDNNSHQDYMPGVVELRHGGGKNTVLCAWADTWRGRFWAKGGTLERP